MREFGWGEIVVFAAAGFLGGFTFLFATDFALLDRTWCINGEHHCVREWVDALSGWIAALVAFFTVGVMWRQLSELQRQSEFALGELWPTAHIEDASGSTLQDVLSCQLVVTNWNRSAVLLEAFKVIEPETANVEVIGCRAHEADAFRQWTGPISLKGWIDRSRPPPTATIQLEIEVSGNDSETVIERRPVTAIVRATLLSRRRESRLIEAHSPWTRVII